MRATVMAALTAVLAWSASTASPALGQGGYHFRAGAARVEVTPPLAGTAAGQEADQQFAPQLAACPSTSYPTQGRFALQEPFDDLNGDGQWDAGSDLNQGPNGQKPDPFCDANGNGRWDGIYSDNEHGPARGVHDPIEVRAVAISDGSDPPIVYASVDAIGIFDYYTDEARYDLTHTLGVNAKLVVSADHNESSPDTIGLYGALETPLGVGLRSGIDEYYMRFLDFRIAQAAATAVQHLAPAELYANQIEGQIPDGASGDRYALLTGMSQRISDQFPTSVALPGDDRVAAVDTKMGVLQARGAGGRPIFTVISLAAHNQEMGNAGAGISGDWPGAMERVFDAHHRGMAMFLVADNGSEEDPETDPTVVPDGSENHTSQGVQYRQAHATGAQFASLAAGATGSAVQLAPGRVTLTREQFCIPLENNGFLLLAAFGEFGHRQTWLCDAGGQPVRPVPNGSVTPTSGATFRTFVSYTRIGPNLEMIDNPGEAFPALMLGSPFGASDESCPRPNPAVPTWHANALFRFQVGLADDLIGYLIPAWGFAGDTPGLFNNDTCSQDQNGHGHKLESESTGPAAANDVANRLTALLGQHPDSSAHIVRGRFVDPAGKLSRWPTNAVAILTAPRGSTQLTSSGGRLIGGPSTRAVGRRKVDVHGVFMDYDGQPQAAPDISTRGIMILGRRGCVVARYYLNVFPDLVTPSGMGRAHLGPAQLPAHTCPVLQTGGVPELEPGAAAAAGIPAQ
ncbi:MAG: hypothetical protein ACJ764_00880 [Solirubrobacteraceae bacterium]